MKQKRALAIIVRAFLFVTCGLFPRERATVLELNSVNHCCDVKETRAFSRIVFYECLEAGIAVQAEEDTFYLWMPFRGSTSLEFTTKLLEEARVLVTPGDRLRAIRERYFRISLSVSGPVPCGCHRTNTRDHKEGLMTCTVGKDRPAWTI